MQYSRNAHCAGDLPEREKLNRSSSSFYLTLANWDLTRNHHRQFEHLRQVVQHSYVPLQGFGAKAGGPLTRHIQQQVGGTARAQEWAQDRSNGDKQRNAGVGTEKGGSTPLAVSIHCSCIDSITMAMCKTGKLGRDIAPGHAVKQSRHTEQRFARSARARLQGLAWRQGWTQSTV